MSMKFLTKDRFMIVKGNYFFKKILSSGFKNILINHQLLKSSCNKPLKSRFKTGKRST